jgi:hypothetical protein
MRSYPFTLCGAALALALAPASSSASTRRHDRADVLYTTLGNGFTSVGQIVIGGTGGSATLIGTNWVLTAAHVNGGGGTGTFSLNGTSYNVTNVFTHPLWSGDVGVGGFDFCLGFIPGGVAGTPTGYYAGNDELGRMSTSVGFGATGTGLTGATEAGGTKRGFTNFIDARNLPDLPGLLTDFDNPDGSGNSLGGPAGLTALEGAVASGDSGGALFVDFFGTFLQVGVTSYAAGPVGEPFGKYGWLSGYADLTLGAEWIQQTTGIAPVTPVPEPATMAVLGLGALALLRRKRGK